MTLTERKRLKHPERYARKDARRMIYRALYGKSEATLIRAKRQNDPALDETRKLPYHWTYSQAEQTFNDWIDAAQLSVTHVAVLRHRLEQLRHHKPQD
jgi:hypothetical protein